VKPPIRSARGRLVGCTGVRSQLLSSAAVHKTAVARERRFFQGAHMVSPSINRVTDGCRTNHGGTPPHHAYRRQSEPLALAAARTPRRGHAALVATGIGVSEGCAKCHVCGFSDACLPPGRTLTLTTGSGTLYTRTVTLAKGEVRTFIVQSTAYAVTPGP